MIHPRELRFEKATTSEKFEIRLIQEGLPTRAVTMFPHDYPVVLPGSIRDADGHCVVQLAGTGAVNGLHPESDGTIPLNADMRFSIVALDDAGERSEITYGPIFQYKHATEDAPSNVTMAG